MMKRYTSGSALDAVERALKLRQKEYRRKKYSYSIPSLWVSDKGAPKRMKIDPFVFYLDVVRKVKKGSLPRKHKAKATGGEWSRESVIYNMFVRTTAAFDHNGNGKLDLPISPEGFRETGTFLKAIAMLPYIKKLGANTVHLLPVTSIGHDGNKGTLGSPYAIKNPYELDENLAEPLLGLDVRTEFKAFVEAAHRMGLRVVVEFVFRTTAKDADWVKEHPEWFYWIKEEIRLRDSHHHDESRYGSPIFTHDELGKIHHDVREHRFHDLIPPHHIYREMFTQPPASEDVEKTDGRYIGNLGGGQRAKIPGAFADWPPDDNQPPWGDVTYLRMYNHSDFNYIAYNTIRMYDARLAHPHNINRPLWDRIVGIIPYYQREFHIDGVMIDMGHALPMELKREMVNAARNINPDFAFWDENFSVSHKSREEGYNAVFGFCWIDEHHPSRMKNLIQRFHTEGFPIPFFATPENHNTPRAADRPGKVAYARWAWVINNFIPAIPFIHSGFEIAEHYPINTGLDFTREDLQKYPSEKLPLFSEYAYDWLNKGHFTGWAAKVAKVRAKYKEMIVNADKQSVSMLSDHNGHILAFARIAERPGKKLGIVSNANFTAKEIANVKLDTTRKSIVDLLTGKKYKVSDMHLKTTLEPGQCLVFEF